MIQNVQNVRYSKGRLSHMTLPFQYWIPILSSIQMVTVLWRLCAKCVRWCSYLFQGSGHTLPDEVDAMILHELSNLVGDLLIEASEEDRPHHDCCLQTLKRGNK